MIMKMIKFVAKRVFSLKTWTQIVVIVFFLSAILRMYSGEDARNAAWDCVAKVGQQTQVVIDNVFEYFGYVPKEAKTENVVSGNAATPAEANADKSEVNLLPTTVEEGEVEEPKAEANADESEFTSFLMFLEGDEVKKLEAHYPYEIAK